MDSLSSVNAEVINDMCVVNNCMNAGNSCKFQQANKKWGASKKSYNLRETRIYVGRI